MKTNAEVFHAWARNSLGSGRSGNVFFEGEFLYSYGKHFAMARHLPGGVVAWTTRGYSKTTAKQMGQARSAASHLRSVYCNDPVDSAATNMRQARQSIAATLHAAAQTRIRQTTRDGLKARALQLAEQANAYLAALPEGERAGSEPIDTSDMEHVRAELQAIEITNARLREEAQAARVCDLADDLVRWRNYEILTRTGLSSVPPALRLSKSREAIETSHGAEIPASYAPRLWRSVLAQRAAGVGYTFSGAGPKLGVYELRAIRADGSIIVGCHDIAYSELEGIARELGLLEEVTQ